MENIPAGDIIQLKSGGTPDKSNPDYWGGSIPWISAKSMYDDFISTSDLFITEEGLQAGSKIAKKDSILLLTRGSGLFNRIPVCYVVSDVAYNQDVNKKTLRALSFYIIGCTVIKSYCLPCLKRQVLEQGKSTRKDF